MATDLPFKALGLQWQGREVITSRQLQAQSQVYIDNQMNQAKRAKEKATDDVRNV